MSEFAFLRAGIEAKHGRSTYDYALSRERKLVVGDSHSIETDTVNASLQPDGEAYGAYLAPRFQVLPHLTIETGLRFDRHTYSSDSDWSPRFNAVWSAGLTHVRGAWGLHHQSEGLDEIDVANGEHTFQKSERAEQRVISVERTFDAGLTARIEAYQRLSGHVRSRWENVHDAYSVFPEAGDDNTLISPSSERSEGLELSVTQRVDRNLRWDMSYALARSEDRVAGTWVPTLRDQRHTVYADIVYTPSAAWTWSAAWTYHTGWPTTDVTYSSATLSDGRVYPVEHSGPLYGAVLPAYHRLDLRASRTFTLENSRLRLFVDVFNAYDRANVVGYTYKAISDGSKILVAKSPHKLFPILPSVGATWEF